MGNCAIKARGSASRWLSTIIASISTPSGYGQPQNSPPYGQPPHLPHSRTGRTAGYPNTAGVVLAVACGSFLVALSRRAALVCTAARHRRSPVGSLGRTTTSGAPKPYGCASSAPIASAHCLSGMLPGDRSVLNRRISRPDRCRGSQSRRPIHSGRPRRVVMQRCRVALRAQCGWSRASPATALRLLDVRALVEGGELFVDASRRGAETACGTDQSNGADENGKPHDLLLPCVPHLLNDEPERLLHVMFRSN
jgi:hypothetical protein